MGEADLASARDFGVRCLSTSSMICKSCGSPTAISSLVYLWNLSLGGEVTPSIFQPVSMAVVMSSTVNCPGPSGDAR